MNKFQIKVLNLGLVTLYSVSLLWSYVYYLVPNFGYYGITYEHVSVFAFVSIILWCILPACWMPAFVVRPTMFLYWMLYLMTYIPMVIGVNLDTKFGGGQRLHFNLALALAFWLTGSSYLIKLLRVTVRPVTGTDFWRIYWIVFLLLFLDVLWVFGRNLTFVGMFSERLYEVRLAGREIEANSVLVGYAIMWLGFALCPFMLIVGLMRRKKMLIATSTVGLFVLYMTMASKAFLLSIGFTYLVYRLFKAGPRLAIPRFTTILLITALVLTGTQVFPPESWQAAFWPIASLVVFRTLSVSTLTGIYYYDFFQENPFTYFSHVNIINKFVVYPYQESLGVTVGTHYLNVENYNANANFYVTDGLAAMGLMGMPVIGFLCAILFYAIDSISKRHGLLLPVLSLAIAAMNFMNVSLFTTLVSGGLLFLMIFLLLYQHPPVRPVSRGAAG